MRRCVLLVLACALSLSATSVAQVDPQLSFGPWSDVGPHGDALRDARAELPLSEGALERYDQYRLDWRVRPARGALEGRQALRFRNRGSEALAALELQLLPELLGATFSVTEARVDGASVEIERVEPWLARLPLPEPLEPGEEAVAWLRYRLVLPEGETPGYGLTARRGGLWSLGHAYALRLPQGRPAEAPSLQGDVAVAEAGLYRLRLQLPQDWSVAVTGTIVADARRDGVRTVEVASGPARDLYALLGEEGILERHELPGAGPLVVGHSRGDEAQGMRAAMAHGRVALATLEALYGPYPYLELEIAPLDTPALGVEFPGVILVAGSALRQRAPVTLTSTVLHEVAHQWFYNVVGSDQVLEPWVDESLAQYATLRVLEERYPEWMAEAFRNDLAQWWGRVGLSDTRIDRPVSAYGDGSYGAIVYGRGPLLLDALAERIGEDRLDALLRDYVAEHRFRRARGADLLRTLQEACGCSLHQLEPDLR